MGLTFRNVKGSALTIDELDDNFSYFTGSHAITGSLNVTATISASSLEIDYDNVGGYSLRITSSDGYETSVLISDLPTLEPLVIGSLWISGSGVGDASGSGYLMVYQG
jgi:hypothetical protein